ncbi:hypothetical protein NE857_09115 [Nocardiopsis exhalans]|uniref:Uncharacterized protein n=1 Tax=Nocardiopsis exhalans TaxID=163604 RepID=A0ABY5DCI8_9ACTN|nr:hypothetical protein [Nocardiopsis exhalans]USY21742.1 hypothetical protein NE857_09115 [Nocardiopsis exhalans]
MARLPAAARPSGLLSAAVTTTSRHGSTPATRGMTSRLEISSASSSTAGQLVLWTDYNPTWVGLDGVSFPV